MDPALLFFAALAVFLCYRLYTVLGTKGGHEPRESDRPRPVPVPTADDRQTVEPIREKPKTPSPAWAVPLQEVDPQFSAPAFIDGAKAAYEMIVQSFASGDLAAVKPYVASSVYNAFESAVVARSNASQLMDVTFVGIEKADVTSATIADGRMKVVVAFQSDQIRVLRNENGDVIDGDPNRIDLVRDIWTFTRPAQSSDPNWTLTATDGAAPAQG